MRKRKELELQILTESIRLWEGDDIKTLGSVLYMSQVLVQSPGSEVPAPSYDSNATVTHPLRLVPLNI